MSFKILKWSKECPWWTEEEAEFFSRVTEFQAQMIRDAFCEGTESDAAIAARVGVEPWVVRLGHRCRLRNLIPAEVPAREVKEVLKTYVPPTERQMSAGVDPPPRCARLGRSLNHVRPPDDD